MDAARLREARRERILNNLEGRLKKITSKVPDPIVSDVSHPPQLTPEDGNPLLDCTESVAGSCTIQPTEEEINKPQATEGKRLPAAEKRKNPQPTEEEGKNGHVTQETLPQESAETIAKQQFMELMIEKFYLLLGLTALTSFFLLRFDYGHIIYENVMLPFYTLSFSQAALLLQKKPSGMLGTLSTMLTFFSIQNPLLTTIGIYLVKFVSIASQIAHNLCVYMFFIVLLNAIFAVG